MVTQEFAKLCCFGDPTTEGQELLPGDLEERLFEESEILEGPAPDAVEGTPVECTQNVVPMLLLEVRITQLALAAWLEQVIGNHGIAPFAQAEWWTVVFFGRAHCIRICAIGFYIQKTCMAKGTDLFKNFKAISSKKKATVSTAVTEHSF